MSTVSLIQAVGLPALIGYVDRLENVIRGSVGIPDHLLSDAPRTLVRIKNPVIVDFIQTPSETEPNNPEKAKIGIRFIPFSPISKNNEIYMLPEQIVVSSEVEDQLRMGYEQQFNKHGIITVSPAIAKSSGKILL